MFGRRVIGEEAAAAQQSSVRTGGNVFGRRVVDDAPAAAAPAAPAEPAKTTTAPTGVPVSKLEEVLRTNPAFAGVLYDAELVRENGPRKDALRIFLKLENEKGEAGEADAKRVAELRALLGMKPAEEKVDPAPEAEQSPEAAPTGEGAGNGGADAVPDGATS